MSDKPFYAPNRMNASGPGLSRSMLKFAGGSGDFTTQTLS
jgi:hypothetical protein